ncbi:MAG: response regulator [Myxococcota bacterium]
MPIHVMIADDHKIVREALQSMLDAAPDLEVVATCADGWEAVNRVESGGIDVVLMDVSMPGLNGMDATLQITAHQGPAKVIALSSHHSSKFVGGMLRAGAVGYLPKTAGRDELISAIRGAARGEVHLSPEVAGQVVSGYVAHLDGESVQKSPELTAREREVLQLIAEGHATTEIAKRLALSVKTIETHRKKIMDKLKIRNVAGLTKYALREGLTQLGDE